MSAFEEENSPLYREDVSINYFLGYVRALSKVKEKSKELTTLDAKLYYKLRHNLLKTYALSLLGMESYREKPFSDFTPLGLESNRTPDFIYVQDDSAFLIEFTISNKYDTVIKTKGFFSKYDQECIDSKIPLTSYYVYMSLDTDATDCISTLKVISERYDLMLHGDVEGQMTDVLDTIKSVSAYIFDYMPELVSMNLDSIEPRLDVKTLEVPLPFPVSKQLLGKKSYKTQRVKSLLTASIRKLSMSLKRRLLDTTYMIKLNFVTRNVYLTEDPAGVRKPELIDMLDTGSGRLLDYCIIEGDVYNESDLFYRYDADENLEVDMEDRQQDYHLVVDSQGYEERFKQALHRYNMKTLVDCELEQTAGKVAGLYMSSLRNLKIEKKPLNTNKSPFIFYPNDIVHKGQYNVKLSCGQSLTDIILRKAYGYDVPRNKVIDRDLDYAGILRFEKENSALWRKVRADLGSDYQKYNKMPIKKLKELDDENAKIMLDFRSTRSKLSELVREPTRKAYANRVRINLKTDSRWDLETQHFKKVKNVHRCVDGLDFNTELENYRSMLTELFTVTAHRVTDSVYSDTEPLGKKLANLCVEMKNSLETIVTPLEHTRLAHSLLTLSQMSYSLLYYSNIKLNKDDFIFDNLGNQNTLLIIKGGKTVRRTKVSRFFRLLVPITSLQAKIVKSTSNIIMENDGQLYLLTPWRMLRFEYLKKGVELYHNYCSYFASSMIESGLEYEKFYRFMSIKTLMLFSQKRRLEVWLSTLRYIYLNALGTHSDLEGLIKSMPILDTDSLVFLLQRLFADGYKRIYEHAKKKELYDILWEETVDNFDLVAERFDETLFMAKAPFNPHNEHIKNLKSLFDTHRYYMDKVGSLDPLVGLEKTRVEMGDDYFNRLEEFDFNFDPKMSYLVGDFLGSYVSSSCPKAEMQVTVNNLLERSFTEIATSKGMRSAEGYFWGKKGNEVIYDSINVSVDDMLSSFPDDPKSYNGLLSEHEITFLDKISMIERPRLEFDMKDKRQFKDSREIYVMSDQTKLLQNPIEKFFAFLCRSVPNELIQRPSNTRPKFIHYKMFEHQRSSSAQMYCTMDCRKWAPRSNLWKYYYFVKGMSRHLPSNFVKYFFKFWTLMFEKRVRIQKHFIENLKNNVSYEDVEDYLIKRDDGDFELVMPYSFMMGIFNYLSSIMHAAAQLYFNDIILYAEPASANFLAHSDDSAGIITAQSYERCLNVYSRYEKFQRSLNHLMSQKKCSLSTRSFEMISIMYCDSRYVPMTHKFMSNIALDCKGGGWYDDVTSICGKIVDLYNSGGTYIQCYSMLLSSIELLRKAYHLPRVSGLSKIPLPFGGVPNFHPVHMIMVGNNSQECLLDLTESDDIRNYRISVYLQVAGDYVLGSSETLRYSTPYHKAYEGKQDISDENKNLLSALATLPDRHTLIDYLKHVNKTFDRKYVYSLTGFDSDQIFLSTVFYKQKIILADDRELALNDFTNAYITAYLSEGVNAESYEQYPKNNYMSYFEQTEAMDIRIADFSLLTKKSCKPVLYNTVENYDVKVSQKNLLYLSAIEKDPRLKSVLTNPEQFESMRDYLMASLPGDEADKIKFLKMYNPQEKEEKTRSGYLFLPSGVNIDTPARFFTYSMLYTTRRNFVSKKRPQLFTPSEFNLESKGFEDLKHFYLLLKLREQSAITLEQMRESLKACDSCKAENRLYKLATHFDEMMNYRENVDFRTRLAFADYHKRQRRGKNVWYSTADFTLYTPFGKVTSLNVEGKMETIWEVSDTTSLAALWSYFRIFCSSRGIKFAEPSYSHTGFSKPKLAFNDFETPFVPQLDSRCVVLPNSSVIIHDTQSPLISRRGNKFFLGDRAVDFKIYSISDVNRLFYETHNLETIKELIYKSDLSISEELLINNFLSSKFYRILLNDPRHLSDTGGKYERNGLLGQPGSLTRALALSDEKGETRYRSSYNHAYINKGVIEFDSVEGVPLLDMFEKVSYARLTFFEKSALEKALSGLSISSTEKESLIRVKNKLGLEALGTAVVLHKHVFETMIAGSVLAVPKPILEDVFTCCIDAIAGAMADRPETNVKLQYEFTRKSFWTILKEQVDEESKGYLPELLAMGLIRSKADNPKTFWDIISKNILLSSMTIQSAYYSNLMSMLEGIITVVSPNLKRFFVDDYGNPKYRPYALARVTFSRTRAASEAIANCPMISCRVGAVYTGDEALDWVDADAEEYGEAEDEGFEAEKLERMYDGEEDFTAICMEKKHVLGVLEMVALEEYNTITILNPIEHISCSWLGLGHFDTVNLDGAVFYRSSFPGNEEVPLRKLPKVKELKLKEIKDLEAEDDESIKTDFQPKVLKSREEALLVLKGLGVYDERLVRALFPGSFDITKAFDYYLSAYKNLFVGATNIIRKRTSKKVFLPGFQGVLEDRVLLAEMKAIFGENCYHIFSGNVRLSESAYNYYMRVIKRMSRIANANDRAVMIALISLMLDTSIEKESDVWFTDALAKYIGEIDARLYDDDEIVLFPPAPTQVKLEYEELDIFD